MKAKQSIIALTMASLALSLMPGCDTQTGALTGAGLGAGIGALAGGPRGALIGLLVGAAAGAMVGKINADQQRALQQTPEGQHAWQTTQGLDHYYAAQPQQPASSPAPQAAVAAQSQPAAGPAPVSAPPPLPVEDIKALSSSGVKPDVIIGYIDEAKTVYTPQDIAAAQQANVDPAVIQHMQKTMG